MKKLNVAIIGQGRSGRDIHGRYFLGEESKKYYNVVAVVDKMESRRNRAAEEFGCPVYEDYKALFDRKDIDLVVNSTFSQLHYPITMDLLNHGFNVVVEKPFSAHASECEAMIKAAKDNNCILTVFQQSRLAPYYKKIREIIDSGVLGEIVQISIAFSGYARRWDWQCSQRYYGGSVLNTGPHPLDQALDLLDTDDMPQVFSCLRKVNTFGDAEDYAKIILTYPNRPLIDVEISSCDGYSDYTYKIQGSKGALKGNLSHIDWKYFDPEKAPERHLILEPLKADDGVSPAYCSEKLDWVNESVDLDGDVFNVNVIEYYERLYDSIVNGKELFIRPEKILQQIRVIEAVHANNPMPILY